MQERFWGLLWRIMSFSFIRASEAYYFVGSYRKRGKDSESNEEFQSYN